MRHFAIINTDEDNDIFVNVIDKLQTCEDVTIFATETMLKKKNYNNPNVKIVTIPDEFTENEPKTRNFISRYYKDMNVGGFLHVISENIQIMNPTGQFLDDVERMMSVLKLGSWFNCSCDPVNYVFSKFNPRFYLELDDEECKVKFADRVLLCSNANTAWICYDLDNIELQSMMFDERYSISMYFIIDFLARRRNTKKPGEFHYMNMYPTIGSELGVFCCRESNSKNKDKKKEHETMVSEDKIFKSSGLDYHPDSSIVDISEDLRNILVG